MPYIFTGNSLYLINKQISAWKKLFIEKHTDFNLSHIKNISDYDTNFFVENITAGGFMNQKKLVIIDIELEKNEKYLNKLEYIISLINNIPEENIVIFNYPNPDKRSKVFKDLKKLSELKEFNSGDEQNTRELITKKYGNNISFGAISEIIKYKSNHLEKIFSEIDKLFITHDYIDTNHVKENIIPELEESIFQIIDDILNQNISSAIEKIHISIEQINCFALYNSLIANLRVNTFILKLKNKGLNSNQINNILKLGNRSFLIDKKSKISEANMKSLYLELVNIDSKMKSGFLLGSDEKDVLLEIEKALFRVV